MAQVMQLGDAASLLVPYVPPRIRQEFILQLLAAKRRSFTCGHSDGTDASRRCLGTSQAAEASKSCASKLLEAVDGCQGGSAFLHAAVAGRHHGIHVHFRSGSFCGRFRAGVQVWILLVTMTLDWRSEVYVSAIGMPWEEAGNAESLSL